MFVPYFRDFVTKIDEFSIIPEMVVKSTLTEEPDSFPMWEIESIFGKHSLPVYAPQELVGYTSKYHIYKCKIRYVWHGELLHQLANGVTWYVLNGVEDWEEILKDEEL